MLVDTILQSKGSTVYTLAETSTLADAIAMLNRHNIGALVVLDHAGRVSGILSERDIIRQLDNGAESARSRSVGSCMTREIVTCERSTPVSTIMEDMTNHRIRHVPVVENGGLAGIISIGDVVKFKIEEVEKEAEELREYIAS